MFLFRRSHSDLNILSDLFRIVNTFFYFFSSFFDIGFFAEKKRRKRDLNPRAATNDLLPFQGSPFSHLGISPKCLSFNRLYSISTTLSRVKRREWDSNPRALTDKRFSRPPRYDHFDISP